MTETAEDAEHWRAVADEYQQEASRLARQIDKLVSIWSEIPHGTKKAIQEEHFMLAECLDKLVKGDGK